MTDGETAITDIEKTAENKTIVSNFIEDVLLGKNPAKITDYISTQRYYQHNPGVADGLDGLGKALDELNKAGMPMIYTKNYRILGEGNFVLAVSGGRVPETAFRLLRPVPRGKW